MKRFTIIFICMIALTIIAVLLSIQVVMLEV